MVAALLHRELRVPPWARQRGLLAFGRVRVCAAQPAWNVDRAVPSGRRGIRKESSLEAEDKVVSLVCVSSRSQQTHDGSL